MATHLVGRRVTGAWTDGLRLREPVSRASVRSLVGERFEGARRRAKFLLFPLSSGRTLLVHLGMTGNLVFRKTARNFNLPAATCGKVCVVEVEEVVPTGSLDPDCIHLPGVYVQRMIVGSPYDKKIEFVTTREREAA